jgi:hypothetical protein
VELHPALLHIGDEVGQLPARGVQRSFGLDRTNCWASRSTANRPQPRATPYRRFGRGRERKPIVDTPFGGGLRWNGRRPSRGAARAPGPCGAGEGPA